MLHRLVAPRHVVSLQTRDQTCVQCIGRWIFTTVPRSAELKSWVAPVSTHGNPELSWVVSGVIFLKVTDEEAEAIINGPEVATILDGGALTPVDPSTEKMTFGSLREVVTRWNDENDAFPTPFEG